MQILEDPVKMSRLQVQLAAVIDAGEQFVKATYLMEGDGPLALKCYEILHNLFAGIHVQHFPNHPAVAQKVSPGASRRQQQWIDYGKACVAPGLQYFKEKFSPAGELGQSVAAFKAARLAWPQKMVEMQPTSNNIDTLQAFPFLTESSVLDNLKKELPVYLTKAEENVDPVEWWKDHSDALLFWSVAAGKIFLVQPSSAAVERVFSLLQNSFSSFQDASLMDYLQASIMLQYNKS